MKKKEEFKTLMDQVLNEIIEESSNSEHSKVEIPLITKNILHMLTNLNEQVEEQKDHIIRVEKQLSILIQELKKLGYINIKERRSLLKRNVLNQDAIVNLLAKKRIINKNELLKEIKRLKKEQPKVSV